MFKHHIYVSFFLVISRNVINKNMAITTKIYNALFRRTSTFAATIIVGAFIFERTFDPVMDGIWERNNSGKLWKHIEPKIKAAKEAEQ